MAASAKTIETVLRAAGDQLVSARIGLAFMRDGDAERRVAGLRNVIVFGRAFTNVIQNLRSLADDFDIWYGPWQQKLKSDPVAQAFYRMRSEILKEGLTETASSVNIKYLQLDEIKKYGPPGGLGSSLETRKDAAVGSCETKMGQRIMSTSNFHPMWARSRSKF